MKKQSLFLFGALTILMASCSTVAEKVSGTYVGPYSSTSLPEGTGTGTAIVTPDGSKQIDILFTSPGNPDVAMNDVSITDILSVYLLESGTSGNGVDGTITNDIMAITYDGNGESISYNGYKQ